MRDPRLVEIDFLSELDRDRPSTLIPSEVARKLGIPEAEFKQMAFTLFIAGCLDGTSGVLVPSVDIRTIPGPPPPPPNTWGQQIVNTQVRALVLGQPFTAHINHEGRLRLWRLRDETIRHRAKDDFGLLWVKRHWDTDLFVRLAMADRPMTILFIDVDDFKKVNDHPALGHIVGDEILRIVFQSVVDLVTVVGGEAYRWGGDEVTAILPDIELDVGRDVGEAIRSTVEDACGRHPKLAKTDLKVTVSVGVLGIKQRAPAREVTERASNLMKQVKRSGKNSVSASFYEDLA